MVSIFQQNGHSRLSKPISLLSFSREPQTAGETPVPLARTGETPVPLFLVGPASRRSSARLRLAAKRSICHEMKRTQFVVNPQSRGEAEHGAEQNRPFAGER